MKRLDFSDRNGEPGYVEGEPGTNFGLRISAAEVLRLYVEHSYELPFEVMAAGYGEDSDWVGLQHDDFDNDSWTVDASFEDIETQWGPFELTIGPLRPVEQADIDAANERGYYIDGGMFDYSNMTPQQALDRIQSRIESYEASVALLPNYATPEMVAAIDVLAKFIKQVNEHGSLDLEWGEPGDCWERMVNDEDTRDMLNELLVEQDIDVKYYKNEQYDLIVAAAKTLKVGRHYGDPHCIWCLQGN